MGVAKQHALFRETLQVRRWYCLSVRLDIAARIVRVQIEDIRPTPGRAQLREGGGTALAAAKLFNASRRFTHTTLYRQRIQGVRRQINVSSPSWRLLGFGVVLAGLPAAALELNGIVISASDRKPLKRAELILRSMEAGIPAIGTITDDSGRFAFLDVAKSRYVLQVSRTGFVPSSTLYQNDARLGVPFAVDRDLTDFMFQLTPAATISGKVRHSDGEPAAGVTVLAYREFYERNRHEYDVATRAVTDDYGQYRLSNLAQAVLCGRQLCSVRR